MGRKTGKLLHVLYLAEMHIHAFQGKLLPLYSWFHLFFSIPENLCERACGPVGCYPPGLHLFSGIFFPEKQGTRTHARTVVLHVSAAAGVL